MNAERQIRILLERAEVEINGPSPWDPQIHNQDLFPRVWAQGSVGLGEAYMDHWWDCERLDEFFNRIVRARLSEQIPIAPHLLWLLLKSRIQNRQRKGLARAAAESHYNIDIDIFEATFDRRLNGSCGHWKDAQTLDSAQEAKLALICHKAQLQRGQRVLDIGSGWGAFTGFAAEKFGVECIGVTVSSGQIEYCRKRYAHLPVEFHLNDYRDIKVNVDHIVSIEMLEHVGPKNYRTYFRCARHCISNDGMFLLQTILANEPSPVLDPWLNKYIFPNAVLPTLGEVATATQGLFTIQDFYSFGADYDKTLMAWHQNFQSRRPMIARKYGDRFCRMWDYYLSGCAGGFRARMINVGQLVLVPDRPHRVRAH
jgi:cyclopropane-fatty-acyl-phospholipid synthase